MSTEHFHSYPAEAPRRVLPPVAAAAPLLVLLLPKPLGLPVPHECAAHPIRVTGMVSTETGHRRDY